MSQPSTPVPPHASLPEAFASPQEQARISDIQAARIERAKFLSPVQQASSMTPPPSSQIVPNLNRAGVRTPTPPAPHLSSPPPSVNPTSQLGAVGGSNVTFTTEQIASASPEGLRTMVNELASALREMRTSAAHYKLQYNMLRIDSAEASNRMAVELAMTQREVDVLQQSEERRRAGDLSTPTTTIDMNLMSELELQCRTLQAENAGLQDTLHHTSRSLEDQEARVISLQEENSRLKSRIRKNREHTNALFEQGWDGSPIRSTYSTPRRPVRQSTEAGSSHGTQPFEALLLADKVLSQDTTTAPTTPTRQHPVKSRFGHTRATHSLSSLPSTPTRLNRPTHYAAHLEPPLPLPRTPPRFHAINAVAQQPSSGPLFASSRRRESSDSTISAWSGGDEPPASDNIHESQASQAATNMLRRTSIPSKSFGQGQKVPSAKVQTKLMGLVTKPMSGRSREQDKRRLSNEFPSPSPKKGRTVDAIGLGIGGLSRGRS